MGLHNLSQQPVSNLFNSPANQCGSRLADTSYRWQAMGKFYEALNESQSSLTGDLSSIDAAELLLIAG
jgi:hypothetical protein